MSTFWLIFNASCIGLLFLALANLKTPKKQDAQKLRSVAILVLGDIGRSPRMMYHAESFASNDFQTYIIGYAGSKPIPSLERQNVRFIHLAELPKDTRSLPFLIQAPLKIALQILAILYALLIALPHPPEFIMVQNPPSIPTLALVQLVCKLRGVKLIIDWHNLGYSILALKLGREHLLVKIAKIFERTFGKHAFLHLFVTKAMYDTLAKEWDLQGTKVVFHDRPPSHFKKSEVFEVHDLFSKISNAFSTPLKSFLPEFDLPNSTPFTKLIPPGTSPDEIALGMEMMSDSFISVSSPSATRSTLRTDRPALLVSSTSWTPDEDFSILLEALSAYEARAKQSNEKDTKGNDSKKRLPKVLTIVTGKGPLKQTYMDKIARREKEESWRWVRCCSLWLEPEDYPLLLGSADLGISLHSSSSALDLPMKVVDMFGCGLPVCALDFKCLPELIKEGKNGLIFRDGKELSQQLVNLLEGFPSASGLETLRGHFQEFVRSDGGGRRTSSHSISKGKNTELTTENEWSDWSDNWNTVLRPRLLERR